MTGASGLCARDRRDRTVEGEIGVDLVGEERKAVLLGDLDQRASHVGRIHRAGRIVRIDGDERARGRGDQAADVIEIRQPAAAPASVR